MPGFFYVLLIVLAVVWIILGRESAEKQLERMGDGGDRLIEDEQRRTPGLTREQAAQRVLRAIRRDSD